MKDILFINHFSQVPGECGSGRFVYLANMLSDRDVSVEMVTSSFSHSEKKQRTTESKEIQNLPYKLTMIYEPGYKKNVCLKRFYSHYMMGLNLRKYLKNRKIPDVIYCSIPSLSIAYYAVKHAKKNNIKIILDIQDLWPEAFEMVFNIPVINKVIFFPMRIMANYAYKRADIIAGVSDTYVKRALEVNRKSQKNVSVYLGADSDIFEMYRGDKDIIKQCNDFCVAYIGTLGASYDLYTIIDAIALLSEKYNNIKFLVMGDGPLKTSFQKYAEEKHIICEFTGSVDYGVMVERLCRCDLAVNPIKNGSAASIINKVGDYAAAALPVINTQQSPEYRNLIDEYSCGFNCENGDYREIADKIEKMMNDIELREKMGRNNRMLFQEKFDRCKTYFKLVELIES